MLLLLLIVLGFRKKWILPATSTNARSIDDRLQIKLVFVRLSYVCTDLVSPTPKTTTVEIFVVSFFKKFYQAPAFI